MCALSLGRASPLTVTLLAWSNIIILLSPCSPRLCQWQHLWVSDLAVLPKHPGEPAGPCWWGGSDQSSAIPIKSCLLPHLSYPSAKGGIKFHFCVLSGKGGNVFQRTKNQRSHLIWGSRIWMWGVYAHVWGMGLIPFPTSQAWSVFVCKTLSQTQTQGCARTAHHQMYGLRQSAPSDNQKASLHESKQKLFTPTQRSRNMQQHYSVCYEKIFLELSKM